METVIPLSALGAEHVTGNPNKATCLVEWSPEIAAAGRKRKHPMFNNKIPPSSASAPLYPNFSLPPPPTPFETNFVQDALKREGHLCAAPPHLPPTLAPPPPPPASSASQRLHNNELLLYECVECGNKYGHKELIKFHLVKKHGAPEADFEAEDRLKKVLSPYNRFCKSVFESVRKNYPDLPNTEHSKIVGNMWREMNDVEKEKYNEEHETEKNEWQAIIDRSEKLWIRKYMCMKCDSLFENEPEMLAHSTICVG